MLFVVCYDIRDDRRRTKVERICSAFGQRVQFSVFEAEIDERQYLELRDLLVRRIDPESDTIRFYRLCRRCRSTVDLLGTGRAPEEGPQLLIV
ncbi:MAG: CRISPR-associated endonuclease Cas2 [Deltaproteobacteria bacterium]|nr:CRISPR-associated endonuclease Cas2 [Deltaproteobacteria bacterium]